jgi:hypothetical protein
MQRVGSPWEDAPRPVIMWPPASGLMMREDYLTPRPGPCLTMNRDGADNSDG